MANTLISLAEYKAMMGVSSTADDTTLNSLIPACEEAIQTYLDRRLGRNIGIEWYEYDRAIPLTQWPCNNLLMIGTPVNAVTITDYSASPVSLSFNTTKQDMRNPQIPGKFTVTTEQFVQTDFLFSTYTTLATLKAAVEAAFPTVTFAVASGYDQLNTLLLRNGSGNTIYGATRQQVLYRIDDITQRTLIIPQNVIVQFNALDYWFETSLCVVWDYGYALADVPKGLKLTTACIVRDYLKIGKMPASGLVKSESIKNYDYTLFDHAKIYQIITENYVKDLEAYRKKLC